MSAPRYSANEQLETNGRKFADLLSYFDSALSALGPFEPRPHLVVAVSGGSDSMALALLTHAYVQHRGGMLTTLTVDHGLREQSKHEAAQVAHYMHAHGITHATLTPSHRPVSNNTMNAARIWRYDALAEWCQAQYVLHCLIAHHADDQAETIAHHTVRGATEDGTSGMRRVRNYHGVRFLRPLLGVTKSTLQAYLRARAIEWIEDPTNADTRYARARLRRDGVPAIPCTATERAAREREVACAAMRCARVFPDGSGELHLPTWRALPPAIGSQVLADVIRTLGQASTRPRKQQTLALAEALHAVAPIKRTLGGCLIRSDGQVAHLARQHSQNYIGFAPAKPLAASPFW